MSIKLQSQLVGPWPMNSYTVTCGETGNSAIIDPGADADVIFDSIEGSRVERILITHGHPDHVGALSIVREHTGAPVYIHPSDGELYNIRYDNPLMGGEIITVGKESLLTIHTPGHTAGMLSFWIDVTRIIVGDTIFVGGPGKTWSPEEFEITMQTMQEIVFKWPDETIFYPGHGPEGTIGNERPSFERFVQGGWPANLYGDITWEQASHHIT